MPSFCIADLSQVVFNLDTESMDQSLASLTTKFLPLCSYCVRIKSFIHTHQRSVTLGLSRSVHGH